MSQFPRPRYQTTLPSGPTVGVQQVGIPDPVMGSSMVDRQLQGALGDLTQAVGIAGNMATRASNERERADAKAEIDAERQRRVQQGAIMRGIATDVRENLPGDIDAIKKGTLAPTPDDKNDPEIFLDRLATERTIDVPEDYREQAKDQFKSLWATRGLNALYAKRDTDQANAQKVAFSGLTDNLLLLDDPSKITATMNEAYATIPGVKPEQLDGVAVSAMFSFAKQGNREMVEGFKAMLGKREIDQQDKADFILATAEAKQVTEREAVFKNYSASVRLRASVAGQPESITALDIINNAKQNGIKADVVEGEVKGLIAEANRQREKEVEKLRIQQIENVKASAASFTASAAMSGGMKVEVAPVQVGTDDNGKPIMYQPEQQKEDAVNAIRAMHGWNGELGPTAGGWSGLTGEAKTSYVTAMGRLGQIDTTIKATSASMQLDNENISKVTKADIQAVQTVMDVQNIDQTYARKTIEAAGSDEADVAELATVLAQSLPQDIPASILEAKRIYATVGVGGLKKLGLEEASIISKQDAALANSPQMLKAASVRARMYMYGKDDPKKAYAKGIADVRATAMEVNGRLVPMGTIYTISPEVKASTEKAAEQLLAGRVKQMVAADERLRSQQDNFTIERLDDERYFVKHKDAIGFAMPRGVEPIIRASEIQQVAAQIHQRDNPTKVKDLPTLTELEAELKAGELAGPTGTDSNEERARGGGTYRVPSLSQTSKTKRVGRNPDTIKQEMAVRRLMDNYRTSQEQP